MDLDGILNQLYAGLAQVNESIAALERIGSHRPRKQGRPPKWIAELAAPSKTAGGKSAAKRKSNKLKKKPVQLEETV